MSSKYAIIHSSATDLLTRNILKNYEIQGVNFQKINFKLAQYAEDTTFAMQNVKDIEDILKELKKFENVSVLKINPEKTQIIASNEYLKNQKKYLLFKINNYLKILRVRFYLDKMKTKETGQNCSQK